MNTFKVLILALGLAALAAPGTALGAPPANDLFVDATELTGPSALRFPTNVDATKELGEPSHGGNAGGASIWYRWTATGSGRVVVSTCYSEVKTLLGVYTGEAVTALSSVSTSPNPCGQQSRLSFQAVSGTTYRIAVDGFDGDTGFIVLSLDLTPPNDDFADAQVLSGDSGSIDGTTIGSTVEDDEPYHLDYAWNSVWYAWTPPSSGWATFETCGSALYSAIAVYTGSTLSALSPVTASGSGCADYSSTRFSFEAAGGTVYRIAIAGWEGDRNSFTLRWNRNPPPPILVAQPRVTGTPRDGETLTASEGSWSGVGPFTYAYQWARCDRDFECDLIPGQTSKTFTIRSVDVGHWIYVQITASNPWGSTSAESDTTSIVRARPPSNTSSPVVEGEGRLGAILVAAPGAWSGTAPISYAYQWQTCDATGTACSNILGQTGQVMRVTSVETGDLFRVVVTATNVVGSVSAASHGTDVIRTVTPRRCVVPKLRGKTLRAARAAIVRNRCRMGRIQRRFSSRLRTGRVLAQRPRPGARLAAGARVHLVLSKGARR
jgi:PASTA domain